MKRISWAAIVVAVGIMSFSALSPFSPRASAGSTWVVDDDGQGSTSDCDSTDTAYSTIQAAIDAAAANDTILVCPGTYDQDEANGRDPDTGGNGSNDFNIFVGKSVTIIGIDSSGTPIDNYDDVAAFVEAKRKLPTFGESTIFVQADGVTITGLDVTGWLDGDYNNKTLEVVGDDFTLSDCALHALDTASSLYFDDRHFNAGTMTSHVQSYHVEENLLDGGGPDADGIRISSGAGWSGPVSGRVIADNTFDNTIDGIAFVGPGGDPWDVYPVGAATITGNSFSRSDRRHVVAWGSYGGGPGYGDIDWQGIVDNNSFDKGAVTWTPGGDARAWTSGSFIDVRGIYSAIQRYAVNKAVAGDTVQVLPGVYDETLKLDSTKAQDLSVIGSGASSTFLTGGIRFEGDYSGLDVEGFTITGDGRQRPGLSQATVGDSSSLVTVTDARFADNVFDGENVADRFGLYLDRLSGSFTFEGNEVKNYEGWGTLDLNQTFNPVTSYTFNDNNIHDNKGSSALRGSSSDRTDTVVADGNTFDNNGGGDSWASLEINEAVSVSVTDNVITDTVAGSWGEGEALQFWHIDSLTVTGNTIDNNYQGIYFPGTSWASDLSGVEIHDNNITNSDQFGFWAEPENTGTADATDNWWGSSNGPTHSSNIFNVGAQGEIVSDHVDFTPWLDAPAPDGASFAPVTTTDPVGSWLSIQAGVNASNPGGTVNAKTGVFSEKVTVNKSVIVQAASSPVVDCGGPGNGFTLGANNVTIDGFEIRNCSNGIQGQTSNSTISNNIIHDNLNYGGSNGVGISLWGDNDNNQISANTIYNNDRQGMFVGHCDFAGPGGACTAGGTQISSSNVISGNVIHDNGRYTQPNGPDASQYGIQLWNGNWNEVKLNEVYNHKGSGFAVGVYLCSADSNDVHDNTVHDNQYNIAAYGCDGSSTGNNIHLNTLSAPTDSNVRLFGGSPSNTVNDNTMSGGVYGVRVLPGNTDTAVTANDILGFKQNGVRIDGSSDVDVSTNNIDGQGACNSSPSPGSSPETDTRCYGVEWIDSTGTISANTITGVKVGAGTGAQTGVGIRASARSGKTTGVTIDHNVVSAYQKNGMVITGQYSGTVSATVDTNTVTGLGPINFIAQNGVQVSSGASATVSGNNISGHDYTPSSWSAAGVLVQNATATIRGNTIHDNMEGAYLEGATIPEFSENTVTATRDVGVFLWLVEDSEVASNTISASGIGLYLADSSSIAAKLNTINGNSDGVVIDGDSQNDTFTNNKVNNNTSTGVTVQPYGVEPSGLVFRLNQIAGNGTYGIDNTTSNVVDALSNWWGDVTGPKHPTTNPFGLGNEVSDNVLFDPWLKGIEYVGDTRVFSGSTANLRARFLNSDGSSPAVAGATINFDLVHSNSLPVPGSPFPAVTDGTGVASVPVPGLGIDLYTVTVRWDPLQDSAQLTVFGPNDWDGDGVTDGWDNCQMVFNPDQINSDGARRPNGSQIPGAWASNPALDHEGDACDLDDDNDAMPDSSESELACPFRLNADSDGDRSVDGYEGSQGKNACSAASKPACIGSTDSDADGFTDCIEQSGYNTCAFAGDTFPGWTTCANSLDSDLDGCADWIEIVDVNGNRSAETLDVLVIAKRGLGLIPASDSDTVLDINKNGSVNALDAMLAALNSNLVRTHDPCYGE